MSAAVQIEGLKPAAAAGETLRAQLGAAVGADRVSDDADRIAVMANDVYHGGGTPLLVVRPASVAALQAAVRLCASAGVAMVPRGGGASYTDGYLHAAGGHVLFDLGDLDRIEVDAANAVVAVGPGTTWAALKATLDPLALRTPFWGPFSGLAATVGGSVSQNAISHGSGGHGISAQSVLGMDIVLASGELLRTGASDATRHFGPDLTGLFTGDCGALGFKAAIRMPLIAAKPHFEALSFAFDSFAAYHAGVSAAARAGLDDEHFGLDLALSQGQIGKQEGLGSRLRIARDVLRSSGLRQLLKMALAGEKALQAGEYMCHFLVEGGTPAEAKAKAAQLRTLLADHAREIPNSVPTFVRAMPFAPLTNILGPRGERWVPLHGIVRHSDAVAFHDALQAFYAPRKADMDRLGIWTGSMFSSVGSTGFLYEIALYWPDVRTAYHDAVLDPAFLRDIPAYAENPEAREYVDTLKRDLIALYAAHGAAHFQIGRAYPYLDRLAPSAAALLRTIKAALDPQGLMNPGVLGL